MGKQGLSASQSQPCGAPKSAAGEAERAASVRPDRKVYWRCYHCGDTFTKAQARWARQHFGRDEGELPVCQMRLPGEHHLLTALRSAQDELAAYRAEDTDLMRAIYGMQADHAGALRREEERGYEKGVADARAEAAARRKLRKALGAPTASPAMGSDRAHDDLKTSEQSNG